MPEIFQMYSPLVRWYLRSQWKCAGDLANDLVSETFVRLLQTVEKGGMPENPRAWLMKVCRHLVIDHLRKSDRQGQAPSLMSSTPGGKDPAQSAMNKRDIEDALGRLPDELREVLVMRYFFDLRSHEIADLLGNKTPGSVRALLFEGRRRLLDLLARE
ncbi:MAG: RNA polymerase sigma-70 factor, ECF subfamily [Candidatus Ozemobacter sibiricus]|uniref:RNA polymerase sigma-70 factor, ECF subfamily n=1 Tax=Candidatus Ozemobacter sibiricus TaxID=2268124 RepID=A0A367ZNN3_9BACT|nr:MAG: RNA polymerase sigma-70 factor, ECF subfamily [Candidatus Ozemobacter sibiricus]